MCGIAGIVDVGRGLNLAARIAAMTQTLRHRGPDGSGRWIDADAGVALGHRRLAIVDLSEAGAQPMVSACGRYVLTYNGELYNTNELREALVSRGDRFRGRSDTEVLLAGIARWGLETTLQKAIGIFALAIWDRQERCLYLARDHLGVKPLFWSAQPHGILFASELRALAALPEFDRTLDRAAIGSFLQYKYIRAPLTIYAAAKALPPGCYMVFEADGSTALRRYWCLAEIAACSAPLREAQRNESELLDQLESVLSSAVSRQLVSDVPIGAFLSGGIDSSTIVAMMQRASTTPVRTFSIGFDMPGFDEAPAARAVAAHLRTDHTELYVTEREALAIVPTLATLFDQPHADVSNIATVLLCRMARAHVTVALSGDGGDELFFGYERYARVRRVRRVLRNVPAAIRGPLSDIILARSRRDLGFGEPGRIARVRWSASRVLHFSRQDIDDAFLHFSTGWLDPDAVARGAMSDTASWEEHKRVLVDPNERMMLHDSLTYLPECVLAKVDRASMAASLEARVPMLDHTVVEHAWRIGQALKHRDGVGKWCLRQILYRHVPQHIVDRPKRGFDAPVGAWLRGALRDWAADLLSRESLERQGVIDPTTTDVLWRAHQSGRVDTSSYLWSLLSLQAWLRDVHAIPAPAIAMLTDHGAA